MSIAHNIGEKVRTGDVMITEDVNFSSLLLSDSVHQGLQNCGFERPSPIQLKAIPLGRCGLDLIVQAKSGTGKTCVFAVIALESIQIHSSAIQVLVLAPTREIAIQIWEVVRSIGGAISSLKCHTFIGGLPVAEDKVKLRKCQIAVGSPGRIKQLIEIGAMKTDSIRLFVLDEADKLLEDSFQEQINWIFSALPDNKQMLALSATYPESLAQHLTRYMRNPTFMRLNISDPALLGIQQFYKSVEYSPMANLVYEAKTKAVVELLSGITFQQCLVFSNLQTRAQNLSDELQRQGWPTACIAGSHDQKDRIEAMARLKTYKCRVLISTDLTSRGIDADKVNLVINLDVPQDHETYLHRIGRAGRFGSYGAAVTIVTTGKEELELRAVERKCNTHIKTLPDPLPLDLLKTTAPVLLDDVVSTEKIITRPGPDDPPSDDRIMTPKSDDQRPSNQIENPESCDQQAVDEMGPINGDLSQIDAVKRCDKKREVVESALLSSENVSNDSDIKTENNTVDIDAIGISVDTQQNVPEKDKQKTHFSKKNVRINTTYLDDSDDLTTEELSQLENSIAECLSLEEKCKSKDRKDQRSACSNGSRIAVNGDAEKGLNRDRKLPVESPIKDNGVQKKSASSFQGFLGKDTETSPTKESKVAGNEQCRSPSLQNMASPGEKSPLDPPEGRRIIKATRRRKTPSGSGLQEQSKTSLQLQGQSKTVSTETSLKPRDLDTMSSSKVIDVSEQRSPKTTPSRFDGGSKHMATTEGMSSTSNLFSKESQKPAPRNQNIAGSVLQQHLSDNKHRTLKQKHVTKNDTRLSASDKFDSRCVRKFSTDSRSENTPKSDKIVLSIPSLRDRLGISRLQKPHTYASALVDYEKFLEDGETVENESLFDIIKNKMDAEFKRSGRERNLGEQLRDHIESVYSAALSRSTPDPQSTESVTVTSASNSEIQQGQGQRITSIDIAVKAEPGSAESPNVEVLHANTSTCAPSVQKCSKSTQTALPLKKASAQGRPVRYHPMSVSSIALTGMTANVTGMTANVTGMTANVTGMTANVPDDQVKEEQVHENGSSYLDFMERKRGGHNAEVDKDKSLPSTSLDLSTKQLKDVCKERKPEPNLHLTNTGEDLTQPLQNQQSFVCFGKKIPPNSQGDETGGHEDVPLKDERSMKGLVKASELVYVSEQVGKISLTSEAVTVEPEFLDEIGARPKSRKGKVTTDLNGREYGRKCGRQTMKKDTRYNKLNRDISSSDSVDSDSSSSSDLEKDIFCNNYADDRTYPKETHSYNQKQSYRKYAANDSHDINTNEDYYQPEHYDNEWYGNMHQYYDTYTNEAEMTNQTSGYPDQRYCSPYDYSYYYPYWYPQHSYPSYPQPWGSMFPPFYEYYPHPSKPHGRPAWGYSSEERANGSKETADFQRKYIREMAKR